MSQKLVLFGDSLFARCSKHLMLLLEARLYAHYDAYNCAVGGWDSSDIVKKAPYIATLKPEVVVISVGTNDASPWKQVELADFEANIKQILQAFNGSKVIFFLPPPVHAASLPAGKEISNQDVKQYHDAAKAIVEKAGAGFINSWEIFMPLQEKGESYHIDDGVHLNDRGYDLLFTAIKEVILSEI